MITVQEAIQTEIEQHESTIKRCQQILQVLETSSPQVLSLMAPYIVVIPPFHIYFEDKENECPELGVNLLNITGAKRTEVHKGYSTYRLKGENNSISFGLLHKAAPCKHIRVTETKVIQVCGKIDESKYDKVEYLDE